MSVLQKIKALREHFLVLFFLLDYIMIIYICCCLSLLQPRLALNSLCSWDNLEFLTLLPAPSTLPPDFRDGRHVPPCPSNANIFMYFNCCLNDFLNLFLCFFKQLVMPGEEGSVMSLCDGTTLCDTLCPSPLLLKQCPLPK